VWQEDGEERREGEREGSGRGGRMKSEVWTRGEGGREVTGCLGGRAKRDKRVGDRGEEEGGGWGGARKEGDV